jgi:hypothetical protein
MDGIAQRDAQRAFAEFKSEAIILESIAMANQCRV